LRDPGLAYQPDVVLVTVMGNDVQDRWVQDEFGVPFASSVLVSARQETLEPSPTWTRVPRAVFPALYPYVWNRLHEMSAGPSVAQAAGSHPPATAARTPSSPVGVAEAVLLALAERYGRREAVEDALASMPVSQLDALRPVLEGTVALDADAADEPYQRI